MDGDTCPSSSSCGACGASRRSSDSKNGSVEDHKPLFRCGQCRTRFYCSRDCQKQDWKRGHKYTCRQDKRQSYQQAWSELQQLVLSTPLEAATEAFHRTNDEMIRRRTKEKNQDDASGKTTDRGGKEDGQSKAPKRDNNQFDIRDSARPANIRTSRDATLPFRDRVETTDVPGQEATKRNSPESDIDNETVEYGALPMAPSAQNVSTMSGSSVVEGGPPSNDTRPTTTAFSAEAQDDIDFDFYIEELVNLSCYQLDVRPVSPAKNHVVMDLEHWSMRVSSDDRHSTVSLYNSFCQQHLSFQMPGHVNDTIDAVSLGHDGRLSVRLSFRGLTEPLVTCKPTSTFAANQVSCVGCGLLLVCQNEKSTAAPIIQRVMPLPSGLWDDMSDYLVCFEGQPSIDFTSSSTQAQRGMVLEDGSVLVYHLMDVVPNLQVLAIPSYGEGEEDGDDPVTGNSSRALPLMRGNRSWSDAVGGATVTCSCCCLVLGVAPLELLDTVRLYKHRIKVETINHHHEKLASVLSFCVQAMIRYAEAKAIFSFLVRNDSNPRAAFILQLVGWEGKAAQKYSDRACGKLEWARLAKVLYERRNDIPQEVSRDNYMWTQGDWCCPPGGSLPDGLVREEKKTEKTTDKLPKSYASLWLELTEFECLEDELDSASHRYTREAVSATFLAKNGRLPERDSRSGLAAVFLN